MQTPGKVALLAAAISVVGLGGGYYLNSIRDPDEEPLRNDALAAERRAYAEAWSNRTDGAFDFRLESNPSARYLLYRPERYVPERPSELWVALFGHPASSESSFAEWWHYARDQNALLLAPEGSTQNGSGALAAHWDREKDPGEIMEMIEKVRERYNVDPKRIAILGTSASGPIIWRMLARNPNVFRFAAVIGTPWAGSVDEEDLEGLRRAGNRMAFFYGRAKGDPTYNQEDFNEGTRDLKDCGFRLESIALDGYGHVSEPFLAEAVRFYNEIKGTKKGWSADLSGPWRARFVVKIKPSGRVKDPGMSAVAKEMVKPEYSDANWQEGVVPGNWNAWGGDWKRWDGEAVLRKVFTVPKDLAGKPLKLNLGYVDDEDDTYVNGVLVGSTHESAPFWPHVPRIYNIPWQAVKEGRNVVAVRVFDQGGGGGITNIMPRNVTVGQ